PVQPSVSAFALDQYRREAVLLQELHRAPRRRDQAIVFAGAEPQEAEAALVDGVVEGGQVLFLPSLSKRRALRRCRRPSSAADDPGAEDADVRELLEMRNRDVQRLVAAHRETGDRAALTIRQHAVVLLD